MDLDLRRLDNLSGLSYPATGSIWTRILSTYSSEPLKPSYSPHASRVLMVKPQFKPAEVYNYHSPIRLSDPGSPDHSLENCAICMDAIVIDSPAWEKGSLTSGEAHGAGGVQRGILNVMRGNVVGAVNTRKRYSLAPCHHLFVSPVL